MSVAKKAVRSGQSALQTVDLSTTTTLDEVVSRLGDASEAEVLALLGPADPAALLADGVQYATARIAQDVFRVVLFAHRWLHDPAVAAATKRDLRLNPEVLRVLAWAGARDEALARALPRRTTARDVAAQRDDATARLTAARALREQLADTLRNVSGGSGDLARAVDDARRPGDPLAVEASLSALVSIGRQLLASRESAVRGRASHWNLDAAWLDEVDAVASDIAPLRATLERPAAPTVTQKELDQWDGVVLRLLAAVVGAFNRANAVNPLVPRVGYVSLRTRANSRARTAAPSPPASSPTPQG